MTTRASAIFGGLGLFFALVAILYGLHRLAFSDGGGPYPLWYSTAEVFLRALTAVAPGILVGWLCRTGALATGAIVGVIGGVAGDLLLTVLFGVPFKEFGGRIAVHLLATAVASGATNAVGGVAGEALRTRFSPSNPALNTDAVRPRRAG
jgi:hypothetical protein